MRGLDMTAMLQACRACPSAPAQMGITFFYLDIPCLDMHLDPKVCRSIEKTLQSGAGRGRCGVLVCGQRAAARGAAGRRAHARALARRDAHAAARAGAAMCALAPPDDATNLPLRCDQNP